MARNPGYGKQYEKPWHRKNSKLKERYGIDIYMYWQMLAEQDQRCAACRRITRLDVDHDHKTGAVRGLLCNPCNIALGYRETANVPLVKVEQYAALFAL